MTRRRAELLLSRRGSRGDLLAPLMDAAVAPATPAELSREQDAVAQFRAAAHRRATETDAHPAPVLRGAARFTTRVGIAATAVFATVTGLAVAAGAGVLPNQLQQPAHDLFHAPAPSQRTSQPSSPTTTPRPRSTTSPRPSSASSTVTTTPAPASSPTTTATTTRPATTATVRPTTSAVPPSDSSPPQSSSATPPPTPAPTETTTPPTSTKTKKSKPGASAKAKKATPAVGAAGKSTR